MRRIAVFSLVCLACAPVSRDEGDAPSAETGGSEPVVDDDDDGFCEHGPLFYGPASLPQCFVGEPCTIALRDFADSAWDGLGYELSENAPPGLELPDARVPELAGIVEVAGFYTFTVSASHAVGDDNCSTIPDPHEFTILIVDAPDTTGGSESGESSETSTDPGDGSTGDDGTSETSG